MAVRRFTLEGRIRPDFLSRILQLVFFAVVIVTSIAWLEWQREKWQWYHYQLHLNEVYNWLPWVILLVLCMLCTWHANARMPPDEKP